MLRFFKFLKSEKIAENILFIGTQAAAAAAMCSFHGSQENKSNPKSSSFAEKKEPELVYSHPPSIFL